MKGKKFKRFAKYLFLGSLLAVSLAAILSNLHVRLLTLKVVNDLTGNCDGIELFYNRSAGFINNADDIYDIYNECYDTNESVEYIRAFTLQPIFKTPREIYHCRETNIKGIDCEDYAHAVMCLSKLYNKTCEYFLEESTSPRIAQHIGIECLLGKKDGEDWWYRAN